MRHGRERAPHDDGKEKGFRLPWIPLTRHESYDLMVIEMEFRSRGMSPANALLRENHSNELHRKNRG